MSQHTGVPPTSGSLVHVRLPHHRGRRLATAVALGLTAPLLTVLPGLTGSAANAAGDGLGPRPAVREVRHFQNGGFQKLRWAAVRGARYYQVFVKQARFNQDLPRNWRLLKTVDSPGTPVHVAQGQTRQFGVRAVGGGHDVRREVTAIANLGTVSRAPRVRRLDQEGRWRTVHKRALYRDTALRTASPGAKLRLRDVRHSSTVRLIAVTGPKYGVADLYVGHDKVGRVDFGRSRHNAHNRMLVRVRPPHDGPVVLVNRSHRPIRISALGQTRPSTKATRTPKAPLSRPPARSFTFHGSGWGHGVGLSQYGAKAMADAGRSTSRILQHYYSGTSLDQVEDDRELDVNVSYHASPVVARLRALSRGAEAEVCAMQKRRCADSVITHDKRAGAHPAGEITITRRHGDVAARVVKANGDVKRVHGDRIRIRWSGTRYRNGSAAVLRLGSGREYRHGELLVTKHSSSLLNAAVRVELQSEYLRGVAEMPSSWNLDALRAQAIIARTYALKSGKGKSADCDCNLFDSVIDQSYVGWGKESEGRNAYYGRRWISAVKSTDGTVLTYHGALAGTYYFSSSGGHTLNAQDVWANDVPYLRSVKDKWSLNSANPYRSWSTTRSAASMSDLFGLRRIHKISIVRRYDGGAVRAVRATAVNGDTKTISGKADYLRSLLGLKSDWLTSVDESY